MYVHVRAHVAGGGEEGTGGEWRERGAGHGNHSGGGGPVDTRGRIQAHTLHAPLLSSQGQSPDVGTLTLSILLKETEVWAFKYHSKGRTSGMITAWIGTKVCPWIFSFYAILQDSCFYLLLWLYPAGPLVHTAKHKTGLTAGQN